MLTHSICIFTVCRSVVDLVFIVGGGHELDKKMFIKSLIDQFKIGPVNGTRVAIVEYSASPKVFFTFLTACGYVSLTCIQEFV